MFLFGRARLDRSRMHKDADFSIPKFKEFTEITYSKFGEAKRLCPGRLHLDELIATLLSHTEDLDEQGSFCQHTANTCLLTFEAIVR